MSDRPPFSPTPGRYAILMAAAGLGAVLAAWLMAGAMGGSGRPAMLSAACTGFGALLALAPALFGPRPQIGYWGLVVVGASMARMILMLALGLALAPAEAVRPFWIGVLGGAGVILVAETTVAALFISRLTHRLEHISGGRSAAAQMSGAAPEHA